MVLLAGCGFCFLFVEVNGGIGTERFRWVSA